MYAKWMDKIDISLTIEEIEEYKRKGKKYVQKQSSN